MSASVTPIHADRFTRAYGQLKLTEAVLALRDAQLRDLARDIIESPGPELIAKAQRVLDQVAGPCHD